MRTECSEHPDIDALLDLASGFWRAKVLLCAVSLDLFSRTDGTAASAETIATELHLDDDAAADFLKQLVSMGLLERDGDESPAVYRTSALAARYLSTRAGTYVGELLKIWNTRSYRMWANLETALRTARPEVGRFPMASLSVGSERFLASFDLSSYRRICVLGSASASLAIAATRAAPHLECTVLDRPDMQLQARSQVAEAGLASRIDVFAGDIKLVALPPADVYILNALLHRLDTSGRRHLIHRVHGALPASGVLVAIDDLVDDAHLPSMIGLLTGLGMLLETGAPSEPCFAEFRAWCRLAGFRAFERLPLAGSCAAAIAYRS